MSTQAIRVADPGATPELARQVTAADVVLGDRIIGTGQVATSATSIQVTGSYEWPPDAPAVVRFSFDFTIVTANSCEVAVEWPGLIPAIPRTRASYIMLLLMGRADFLITTPAGDHVTAAFMGPFGQPEITTALQVAVATANGAASQSLIFRYKDAGS